jgi:non-ribosomal peptide synthetase-like protein
MARGAIALFVNSPTLLLLIAFSELTGTDADDAMNWLFDASGSFTGFFFATAIALLHVPLMLLFSAFAMRLLGRVQEGVISRYSPAYIRVWLKTGVLQSANAWLLGSLFWPIWLRMAGMKVGKGCEMSTIIDTIPELVEVGPGSFFADGIYLAGPRVQRGTVTLAMTRMGKEVFLGNNVLIAIGQTIPDGVLLGVSTVADEAQLRPSTSWFGQPPFELPKREIVTADREMTHAPKWRRFLIRLFWDAGRFTLPLAPLLLVVTWFKLLALAAEHASPAVLICGVVPALDFGVLACLVLFGFVLKWVLLGRVKPGVHPLWSSWCSRWEFHYVAWDLFSVGPLAALEGTLLLNWVLRAMGMKIGRHVVLQGGFAHTIDHDMLEFEDGATASCMFQAHTFEDRVLKIDRIKVRAKATIGAAAVVLYGADIGASAYVSPHSVVMKHEKLLPQRSYAGAPTQAVS